MECQRLKPKLMTFSGVAIIVHKSVITRICNIDFSNVRIEIVYIKVLN